MGSVPVVNKEHLTTLFVYGTLKSGEPNHGVLKRYCVKRVGWGWTEQAEFEMKYLKVEQGFPVMLRSKNAYRIKGEVYRVQKSYLRNLDLFEGPAYNRCLIPVVFYTDISPMKSVFLKTQAWAYIGKASAWDKTDHLEPAPLFTMNSPPNWLYAAFGSYLTREKYEIGKY